MRKLYVRGFSIFPPRCQTPLFITVFSSLRGRGTRTNLYKKEVMILQKEQFDITGMTCSACSTRVEKSVAKLPGIKEVSVNLLKNSMVGIPNINSGAGMDTLVGILGAAGFGQLNAFCLMIFCLLYVPCAAALATIRKESGSTRWMLFSALFQLVVAWAVTFVVYRVGLLL